MQSVNFLSLHAINKITNGHYKEWEKYKKEGNKKRANGVMNRPHVR